MEVHRRYYANEGIWRLDGWIATSWWIIRDDVDGIPSAWQDRARPVATSLRDEWAGLIDRYVAAVSDAAACSRPRFARAYDEAHGWRFQSVYGKAPIGINTDVRDLIEKLTLHATWRFRETTVIHNSVDRMGSVFGRWDEGLGLRAIVAGRDPRNV